MQRIPVYVLIPTGALLLDIAGPIEVLRRGNLEQSQVRFDVTFLGARASVPRSIGLELAKLEALPTMLPAGSMVVVAGRVEMPLATLEAPSADSAEMDEHIFVDWLQSTLKPEQLLVTVCSGAFLAGRAGLLDGRSCTTHHDDCDLLQRTFPNAIVLRNRLYVQDGNTYSSAGVTSGIDLMLHLLERLTDHGCAVRVARYLVVYIRRAGTDPQLSPWLQERDHIHPVVLRAQDAIRANPSHPWTRSELAKEVGSSGRHLSRLFHQQTGLLMSQYRNRIRVAIARELLTKSQLDMESIAERAGFESSRTFRRVWRVVYGGHPTQTGCNRSWRECETDPSGTTDEQTFPAMSEVRIVYRNSPGCSMSDICQYFFKAPHMHSFRIRNDVTLLTSLSCILVLLHFAVGSGYGFHRDELQLLDSSRHLAWGYVAYPPMTAFMGRLSIAAFGISVQAYRLPAMFAAMLSLVLTGLTTKEIGGRRSAQVIALFLALGSQVILASLMLYVVWDFLAWTLICHFLARLLRTGDSRWWLAVGAGVGVGILSKYSIAFLVVSILAGIAFLPSQRHHLRDSNFYLGVLVAIAMASPNLVWEAQHGWITFKMLSFIHARDIHLGRDQGFLLDQLKYTMLGSLVAAIGLIALLRSRQFRLLAFFYLGPLVLFLMARGRGYYLIPAYTPLYAAGAMWIERKLATLVPAVRRVTVGAFVALGLGGTVAISIMMLPISCAGSKLFAYQMRTSSDMRDETGWPQFVQQIAQVRDTLPSADRDHLGIIAGNYGEAGALALYGPSLGLPAPMSLVNSFHDRGYPMPPPETLIVVGESLTTLTPLFRSCTLAAHLTTQHHQSSPESEDGPVFVCREPTFDWAHFWASHQRFG